jgi:glycosyltransferase involved in cell wall biosynthesis
MNKEKTICLNMIVRNEAQVIERCLASLLPVIDYWVICDTGSTDETPAIIAKTLASVPGELHHHTWVNFGVNRTMAMKIAEQKADYVLLIDADMVLNIHREFKTALNANSYLLRYTGALDYWQTMLVEAKCSWQYVGPTHEYIFSPLSKRAEKLDAISLTHFADGGERTEKFTRDIKLLETALASDPNNPRYLFYLAQSYTNLGDFARAITVYQKRVAAGGWEEERWYSMYQLAVVLEKSGAAAEVVVDAYLRAYEYRPSRAEPLYHLAKMLRNKRRYALALLYIDRALKIAYPPDILFIEKTVYDYLALLEYGICAHYAGQAEDAIRANDMVIGNPATPYHIARQAIANKRFSLKKFINERGSAQPKRIAAISFDLNFPGGSGISLKNLVDHFSRNNWPVWSAPEFPADQVLEEWKPCILISQQWAINDACQTAQRLQLPWIQYVHGPDQYKFPGPGKMKPDFLIFCSSHEYFSVKKYCPEIEGFVLHPIVLAVAEKQVQNPEYITLIGGRPDKGVDIFFAIATKMPEEKFLLVGDLKDGNVLPQNVKHLPHIKNIDEAYNITKLLLAPSVNESYCRVVVEAARHGIVSVVTDCPGIREATGFENAVYIADRMDIAKWVDEINTVLKYPEKFSIFPKRICEELDTELELQYAALKIAGWAGI